jgi:methionyl-tRNA formyltransferase
MSNDANAALKVIFMGTADLACASLKALLGWTGCRVIAVVTQPDKPRGRDLKLMPTAVKEAALAANVPVLQQVKSRDPQFVEQLRQLAPDLIVVAAFGQILPQALLDIPRFGCLNVHTSLLPRHRGAAPIQWAIAEGDAETGVTIMKMDAGLDTGPMISTATTPIRAEDDGQSLHDRLAAMGAELLVKTIPGFVSGKLSPRPQPAEGVTYARKITKDDGRIDWTLSAGKLWNRIRAFTPWPGAFTTLPDVADRKLLKVFLTSPEAASGEPGTVLRSDERGLLVACGQGGLLIGEVQREGGRRLKSAEFLRGFPLPAGQRFT